MLKMKKQNKQTVALKRVTVGFGYALFYLSLIALIISTIIPMSDNIFNPAVRHVNVTILLFSLIAGAVLPPLVSYIIGNRATHSKAKVDHHFNGVLFGIASYWLSVFFSFIGAETVSNISRVVPEPLTLIIPIWPVLPTLVIMTTLAIIYARNKKKQSSVLEYNPYQLVLFAGVMATFAYTLFSIYFISSVEFVVAILYIVVPTALISVSYMVLPIKNHRSSKARLTLALVAVSLGFITASIAGQLIPFLSYNTMIPIIVGVMVLAFYLLLVRRIK